MLAESCPGSTQPGCVGLTNSTDSAAASSSFLLLHVPVTSVIEALLPQLGKLTLVTVFAGATPRRGPGCASLELTPERRGALRQSHQPVLGLLMAPRDPRTSAHGGMQNKGQRGTTTSPAFIWACAHNLGAEGKLPASAQRHPPGRGLTQTQIAFCFLLVTQFGPCRQLLVLPAEAFTSCSSTGLEREETRDGFSSQTGTRLLSRPLLPFPLWPYPPWMMF